MSTVTEPLLSLLKEIEPEALWKLSGYCARSSSSAAAYYVKLGEPDDEERFIGSVKRAQCCVKANSDMKRSYIHRAYTTSRPRNRAKRAQVWHGV